MKRIDKSGRDQLRRFALTNRDLKNFGGHGYDGLVGTSDASKWSKLIDKAKDFLKGDALRIDNLSDITHITYSNTRREFILHIPNKSDYLLWFHDVDRYESSLIHKAG